MVWFSKHALAIKYRLVTTPIQILPQDTEKPGGNGVGPENKDALMPYWFLAPHPAHRLPGGGDGSGSGETGCFIPPTSVAKSG